MTWNNGVGNSYCKRGFKNVKLNENNLTTNRNITEVDSNDNKKPIWEQILST